MRPNRDPLPAWAPALLLLGVGVVLRVPALALPLGPEDAVIAEAADDLARGTWPTLEGRGPLLPALLAPFTLLGLPAALVMRWLGLLVGAWVAVFVHRLATGIGLSARGAGLVALLTAVHPLMIAHVGGAEAGAQGLALALLVSGLGVAVRGQRPLQGLACLLLAVLAHPGAWPYLLLVGTGLWWRAPTGGPRSAWGLLGAAGLGFAWLQQHPPEGSPGALPALLVVLGLVVLLPALLLGAVRLMRAPSAPAGLLRLWVLAGLLHAGFLATPVLRPGVQAGAEGLGPAALLVPLAMLCAVVGSARLAAAWRARCELGALALALAASLLVALGPAQAALLGERAGLAGRLHALRAAMRLAAEQAGPDGWIAVDLGEATGAQGRALAAWSEGRRVIVSPDAGGPSGLPPGWPPGGPRSLTLLTVRPEPGPVGTLGGLGISAQERAGQSGAYHVLRARRP
jgi:hypothetical protein